MRGHSHPVRGGAVRQPPGPARGGLGGGRRHRALTLLNVSNHPTREPWRELNAAFAVAYESNTGRRLAVWQSHGESGARARAVTLDLTTTPDHELMWRIGEYAHDF